MFGALTPPSDQVRSPDSSAGGTRIVRETVARVSGEISGDLLLFTAVRSAGNGVIARNQRCRGWEIQFLFQLMFLIQTGGSIEFGKGAIGIIASFICLCHPPLCHAYMSFAFCWVNLVKIMGGHHCNLWRAILKSPVSAILIVYTFIAAWFVGGLTAFHTCLVCTNQTTYENFRYRYDGRLKNPYNRGCFLNIMEIFFSRIPKSQNHFRA